MTRTIGDMLDSPQELQSWLHDITACQAMLHAVATTRLLEQWDSQPVTLGALAARTRMEEARLGRLIRLLAAQGILELGTDGSIGHTPRSRNLRAFRSSIMVQRIAAQSGLHLGEALRTGATAFETCFGKPVFEYFAENPEQAGYFGERMSQMTAQDEPLLLAQLGGPFTLAVDIGGSHGTLLAGLRSSILRRAASSSTCRMWRSGPPGGCAPLPWAAASKLSVGTSSDRCRRAATSTC